jgi:TonB family protein
MNSSLASVPSPAPRSAALGTPSTPLRSFFGPFRLLCALGVSVASLAVAGAQEIKQAGTDVPPPKRTKFVAPTYPPEAQASGQRGIVILELIVGPSGKVDTVNVVRSVPPFDESALAAVRQWEYEVTRVDGKPVSVRLTVPITFALKLPSVTRSSGVPELRMGAAPALPPQPWSRPESTVEADVTIDADGQVTDALVTEGDSPWAEALLQALRTWRFVGSPGEGPLTFKATARFVAADGSSRVDLSLSDPRRAAAPASPEAPPMDTPAVAAMPSPAAPGAAEPSPTAPPVAAPPPATGATSAPPSAPPAAPPPSPAQPPTAPPSTAPPAAAPPSAPASPAAPPTATGAPASPPARPATGQAPPIEVVPAAPPPPAPPAPPEGGGGSAVRGIQLGEGVPDLVSGRRPVVPPLARLKTVTGKVLVRFAVDASGSTSAVEAEGADPLREAARQAVASWLFRRTKADRLRLAAEFDYGAEAATATVGLEAAK